MGVFFGSNSSFGSFNIFHKSFFCFNVGGIGICVGMDPYQTACHHANVYMVIVYLAEPP